MSSELTPKSTVSFYRQDGGAIEFDCDGITADEYGWTVYGENRKPIGYVVRSAVTHLRIENYEPVDA